MEVPVCSFLCQVPIAKLLLCGHDLMGVACKRAALCQVHSLAASVDVSNHWKGEIIKSDGKNMLDKTIGLVSFWFLQSMADWISWKTDNKLWWWCTRSAERYIKKKWPVILVAVLIISCFRHLEQPHAEMTQILRVWSFIHSWPACHLCFCHVCKRLFLFLEIKASWSPKDSRNSAWTSIYQEFIHIVSL